MNTPSLPPLVTEYLVNTQTATRATMLNFDNVFDFEKYFKYRLDIVGLSASAELNLLMKFGSTTDGKTTYTDDTSSDYWSRLTGGSSSNTNIDTYEAAKSDALIYSGTYLSSEPTFPSVMETYFYSNNGGVVTLHRGMIPDSGNSPFAISGGGVGTSLSIDSFRICTADETAGVGTIAGTFNLYAYSVAS